MARTSVMAPRRKATIMMVCGKHIEPFEVSEDEERRNYKPRKKYLRKLNPGEKRGSCLCDYHEYYELLKERKDLTEAYKKIKKPFKLMKLPAELRNRIYEELLVFDEAIEFCPEPFLFNGENLHRGGRNSNRHAWLPDYDDKIRPYHYRKFYDKASGIKQVGAFLRTSKQIAREATPILYGSNEFRFSNLSAYIALDYFMHNIGLEKSAMLRYLTVCHPDYTIMPTSNSAESDFVNYGTSCDSLLRYDGKKTLNFNYSKRWFERPLTKRPTHVLEKAGELRQLRVIVPVDRPRLGTTTNPTIVNLDWFDNIKVTIAKLLSTQWYASEVLPGAEDIAKSMADDYFKDTGVKLLHETHTLDEFGRYPLIAGLRVEEVKEKTEVGGPGGEEDTETLGVEDDETTEMGADTET